MITVNPHLGLPRGYSADAQVGDTVFEVIGELRSALLLRAKIMDIAFIVASSSNRKAIVLLVDPLLTNNRIEEEWAAARATLRREVFDRAAIIVRRLGQYTFPATLPSAWSPEKLNEIIDQVSAIHSSRTPRKSEAYYDILRVLILQWMRRAGPMTVKWLGEAVGCSYPTVAAAIDRLDKHLLRHSDRKIELRSFPRDEWFRLLTMADGVRATQRFADRSGQPRSPASLVERVRRLRQPSIAVGGVLGARHYLPSLDLVGEPRLDLTIQSPNKEPDLNFIRKLDPALQPAGRDETPSLVIHVLRRPMVTFETGSDGTVWADPVECLLDLHEARLEPQALEFLKHFSRGNTLV